MLRLFESSDGVSGMPGPLGAPAGGAGLPPHWEDQSYFSEPEFDSEFQHQHIHKSKVSENYFYKFINIVNYNSCLNIKCSCSAAIVEEYLYNKKRLYTSI